MKLLTNRAIFFNVKRSGLVFIKVALLHVIFMLSHSLSAQILFVEECFTGGVTVSGAGNVGSGLGIQAEVRWEPGFTIRRIYAVTHRFGHIAPHTMRVNGGDIYWDDSSQVGLETPLLNPDSSPFAVHVRDVTETVIVNGSVLSIDFPEQQFYDNAWNWGWWSVYLVILYESPTISTPVCVKLYTADQRQDQPQNYSFLKPEYEIDSPIILSLFAARINSVDEDKSRIVLNNELLGDIKGFDPTIPPTIGTQGHFFYENGLVQGLNGDTANVRFLNHDAIALINDRLVSNMEQSLNIFRILPEPGLSSNLHPAFTLTFTPSCPLANGEMPRAYTFCRGDSVQFTALPGYDHYAWTPAHQLSDSAVAIPICSADSSRWYRVRMWNDDETGACAQTIPVFVTVGQTPRPGAFTVNASTCPNSTGRIRMEDMHGTPPFQYTVGAQTKAVGLFEQLAAGTYPVGIVDALGCTWDTVAVVKLNVPHNAAFTANPQEGDSPLDVHLTNQSTNPTPGSMTYQWLIDNDLFSTNTNTQYNFPDTGTYTVSLIAILGNPACADTAIATIRVNPGIRIVLPNIFTPNGDGLNDKLVAELFGVSNLSWGVYNRWGNLIHSGNDTSGDEYVELWDGSEATAGVYAVILTGTGLNGKPIAMQSTITLGR